MCQIWFQNTNIFSLNPLFGESPPRIPQFWLTACNASTIQIQRSFRQSKRLSSNIDSTILRIAALICIYIHILAIGKALHTHLFCRGVIWSSKTKGNGLNNSYRLIKTEKCSSMTSLVPKGVVLKLCFIHNTHVHWNILDLFTEVERNISGEEGREKDRDRWKMRAFWIFKLAS